MLMSWPKQIRLSYHIVAFSVFVFCLLSCSGVFSLRPDSSGDLPRACLVRCRELVGCLIAGSRDPSACPAMQAEPAASEKFRKNSRFWHIVWMTGNFSFRLHW